MYDKRAVNRILKRKALRDREIREIGLLDIKTRLAYKIGTINVID